VFNKCSAVAEMDDRLATIIIYRHGPKIGGCAPLGGGAGSPSNTMSPRPGLSPYQVASWSIQPFGHNTPTSQTGQTNRTDRQTDNRPIT